MRFPPFDDTPPPPPHPTPQELVEPFVSTLLALLSSARRPRCVLAFQERATAQSETFVQEGTLMRRLEEEGCVVEEKGKYDAPGAKGLKTKMYLIWVPAGRA